MNVLELNSINQKFDLICSDAFLTRFSKSDASKVLKEWYNALNPNGLIVTTVRCRSLAEHENEHQKDKYIEECINRFQKWEGYFSISIKTFEDMVRQYVENMTSHNLGDKTDIFNMFKKQNFIISDLTTISDTPGEIGETTYCEICCGKGEKYDS